MKKQKQETVTITFTIIDAYHMQGREYHCLLECEGKIVNIIIEFTRIELLWYKIKNILNIKQIWKKKLIK